MKKILLFLVLLACMGASAFAQVNIPGLTASSGTVNDADLLIIEQRGVTYKITASQAKTYFGGGSGYTLPVATPSVLGGVKQGSNVTIAGDGTISISSLSFSLVTGTPTTLAGYGITDPIVLISGSYTNPSWITSLAYSKLTGAPTLATVATSGSYTDLSNKPTIPAAQVNSDWSATSGVAQVLNHPITGTQTIGNASDTVTVTGLGLGFTPSYVIVTIRKVTGGANLFGTVRGDSMTSDGFTVDLSGITDTNAYHLDYLIVR